MHLIPSRRNRGSDDPIFALHREATERRERGEAIVNATVGALLDDEGRLMILPTAARVVHEVPAEEWAAYAPIAGMPEFLRAVQDDLLASEPALRAASVASATPGGSGALRHAIANYLDIGQEVLTPSFYWSPYQTLATELGRGLTTFNMFDEAGTFDIAALDRRLEELLSKQGRALVILNDPCNNPTGYSLRTEEWRGVVEVLLRHGTSAPVTLLVDVAYAAFGEREWTALSELAPLLGKVGLLFAWTASKSFTHYGLRVGALVACVQDAAERVATEAAFSYSSRGTWSNCNRGGLLAVTRLLTEPALVKACREERARCRDLLNARVHAFNVLAQAKKGLRYPRYEGGFFVTVFTADAPGKAACLREAGVFVVPIPGALRVALCSVAERDVPRLVDALASCVRADPTH